MRSPRRASLALIAALAALTPLVLPGPAASAAPSAADAAGGLDPGRFVQYRQETPVNVVLVGYGKDRVAAGLKSILPRSSTPVVRYPRFYGVEGRKLGLRFDYAYRIVDTPKSFEDRFFGRLRRNGAPSDLTTYQQDYNDQKSNIRNVTGPVLTIDAPSTERYLERAAQRRLGINTSRSYTVFLVNWYGRSDFRFHVYRTTDEPDVDTNYNFGALRESRAMIAWGGSSGRSWFYDLSAGPEAWSSNWNVDDADIDGDGKPDYRMPPIWEYAPGGYRDRSRLGADLGRVVRYIGLNLLFTSSPLYDPLVTAPDPGGVKRVRINMFEDDPGSQGTDWIRPANSLRQWQQLEPYHQFRVELRDFDPIPAGVKRALNIWAGIDQSDDCWNAYGDPFAELFCWFDARRSRFLPPSGRDYVEGVFAFNTTDAAMGDNVGLLGYADDNWVDGTQSYVFEFDTPEDRALGYGFTSTTTHEVGHHLGLSHPHDGYDPATGVDYDATGRFNYVWTGDESDTVMSYLAVSNGFSVFDKDNMARYYVAGYLNWANAILGRMQTEQLPAWARDKIARADRLARAAQGEFRSWDYRRAAGHARYAWSIVRRVAENLGVATELRPDAQRRLGDASAPRLVDPIRYPDERPVSAREAASESPSRFR